MNDSSSVSSFFFLSFCKPPLLRFDEFSFQSLSRPYDVSSSVTRPKDVGATLRIRLSEAFVSLFGEVFLSSEEIIGENMIPKQRSLLTQQLSELPMTIHKAGIILRCADSGVKLR